MNYYLMNINYSDSCQAIFSTNDNIKLKRNDVVIVPDGCRVQFAVVVKEVDGYEALSQDYRIESIITTVDLTEFKKKINNQIKARQIEEIMEEKMDEIKKLESYRKVADKHPEFKRFFEAYEELLNPKSKVEESLDSF